MCEEKKNGLEELKDCECGCDCHDGCECDCHDGCDCHEDGCGCGCGCDCGDEGCYIELTDEDGNTAEYAIIDAVEYEDRSFAVLATEDDPENVVILEFIEGEGEEGTFVTVDDEELLKKVFDLFVESFEECGCEDCE